MHASSPLLRKACTHASVKPFTSALPRIQSRDVKRQAAEMPSGMQEALKKVMGNPEMMKQLQAVQEAMKRPEVQQQMQQMQAFMGNPQLQARMQTLKDDPEFADFFKEIQTGGMQALMKYYNDPAFLSKLSGKLGDVSALTGGAAAAAGAAAPAAAMMGQPAAPEITNLLEAARYGDIEAVEDFIAIGKDVNMADKEGRTPLHYAAGYDQSEIAQMLISEGAKLEAVDSMGNTPLHYASGYGRPQLVSILLEAGASKTAKNNRGSTPYDVGTADKRNPVSQDEELKAKLKV